MAAKTFIPQLVRYLHLACVYIAKYKKVIVTFLPEGGDEALDAIVAACDAFMILVPDNTGG